MVELQPITTPDHNNTYSNNTSEQTSPSSSSPTSPLPILLQSPLPPSSTSFPTFHFQEPIFSSSPYPLFQLPPYYCVYICRLPEQLYPPIATTFSVPPPPPPPPLAPFNGGTCLISVVANQNDGVLLHSHPPPVPAGVGYRNRKRFSKRKPRATWNGYGEERWVKKERKPRQKVKTWKLEHTSGAQSQSRSSPPPLRRSLPQPPYSGHLSNCTTVMVKNIPNSLSRRDLMDMLDSHCWEHNHKAAYDFLYLPFDFYYNQNLGYAFVNFTTAEGAATLGISWNGTGWPHWTRSSKICQIFRAKLQGLERCKRHFEVSNFCSYSRNFLPVEFSPPRDGSHGGDCKMAIIGRWLDSDAKHWRSKTIIPPRLGYWSSFSLQKT